MPKSRQQFPSSWNCSRTRTPTIARVPVFALGQMGSAAKAAVAALTGMLKDKEANICGEAAFALEQIGPEARAAVPALMGLLGDKDEQVRMSAADVLGQIGPAAKAAIPVLMGLLRDKDEQVRMTAPYALAQDRSPREDGHPRFPRVAQGQGREPSPCCRRGPGANRPPRRRRASRSYPVAEGQETVAFALLPRRPCCK